MDFVLTLEGWEVEPLPQRKRKQRHSGRKKKVKARAEPEKGKRKSSDPPKRRQNPTHFLALRLPSQVLAQKGKIIQQAVLSSSTDPKLLSHAVVDTRKLHLTLFVMHLQDKSAVKKALSVLEECAQDANIFDSEPRIELKGVGTFRQDVLFIQVEKEAGVPLITKFQQAISRRFRKAGLIEENKSKKSTFKPHATLMKMSQASRKVRKKEKRKALRKLPLNVPEAFGPETKFGYMGLHYLELNEMRVAENGYYVTAGKVPLSSVARFLEEDRKSVV